MIRNHEYVSKHQHINTALEETEVVNNIRDRTTTSPWIQYFILLCNEGQDTTYLKSKITELFASSFAESLRGTFNCLDKIQSCKGSTLN